MLQEETVQQRGEQERQQRQQQRQLQQQQAKETTIQQHGWTMGEMLVTHITKSPLHQSKSFPSDRLTVDRASARFMLMSLSGGC